MDRARRHNPLSLKGTDSTRLLAYWVRVCIFPAARIAHIIFFHASSSHQDHLYRPGIMKFLHQRQHFRFKIVQLTYGLQGTQSHYVDLSGLSLQLQDTWFKPKNSIGRGKHPLLHLIILLEHPCLTHHYPKFTRLRLTWATAKASQAAPTNVIALSMLTEESRTDYTHGLSNLMGASTEAEVSELVCLTLRY